jgi:hypothetical protein
MKTLIIKDLSLTEELDRKAMAAVHGGRINLNGDKPPHAPIEPGHGGGTSWEKGGMRGLSPTFAIDGSPAPVHPY